ncbi:hypothetical protein AU190_20930 [Mycolicibacterium acapulense]|nr:hypothetical protein AU190_20930 [Mycolicibacterium acapulense]KUI12572.1 hypothetical protein AU191_20250 [Mycolicibacterium acapulense]
MRTYRQAKVGPRGPFRDRECSFGETLWAKGTLQMRGDRIVHKRLDSFVCQVVLEIVTRFMIDYIYMPHVFASWRDFR